MDQGDARTGRTANKEVERTIPACYNALGEGECFYQGGDDQGG